ncbi:hypothetical protein G3T14_22870 [Methylobacterium sp. BTF04]|uniref:hypothetical protein n=1 Tax=Methylobacterium sp. BTF04 TaxID=2708300 RepID=UPI0013D35423|nr:hypothetical protein [Methylobacterium sp. BTF04]NEU14898.1 hypothetical protein [Methylobacterium sp. BTF04]
MARLPALLDLMTEFGVAERRTLEVYARKLREAGLISEGRKGVGAARVTPRDAAMIVLATMVTDSPSAGPNLIAEYGSLKILPGYRREDDLAKEERISKREAGINIEFDHLYDANTSIDALENLIKSPDYFWVPELNLFSQPIERDKFGKIIRRNFLNRYVTAKFDRAHPNLEIKVEDSIEVFENDEFGNKSSVKFDITIPFERKWSKRISFGETNDRPRFIKTVAYDGRLLMDIANLIKVSG